jgi:hypothetical protein
MGLKHLIIYFLNIFTEKHVHLVVESTKEIFFAIEFLCLK